ncbi:histidine phosphatase family protein [Candidatus Woesearchaeota archaeon]|nr:histidine phosphatase family protein [Candidatus Woesearchaeota archaeon]
MTRTLYIVRHGLTYGNLEDRVQGRDNSGFTQLTNRGIIEVVDSANKLRRELAQQGLFIGNAYTSPLTRTKTTVEVTCRIIGYTGEIIEDERLLELDVGDLTRKTRAEIQASPELSGFYTDPDFRIPGSAETQRNLYNRVVNFVEWAMWQEEDIALVGTHNGPLRCLQAYAQGLTLAQVMRAYYSGEIRYSNALLIKMDLNQDGTATFTSVNDGHSVSQPRLLP